MITFVWIFRISNLLVISVSLFFNRKFNFAFGGIVPQPKPNATFSFPKFDYRL